MDKGNDFINTFNKLEKAADCLLQNRNAKSELNEEYSILTERKLQKILSNEESLEALQESEEGTNKEIINIVELKECTKYISQDFKIKKDDLCHQDTAEILNYYNNAKKHLLKEMNSIRNKEESYLSLNNLRKMLKDINSDMILVKIQKRGIRSSARKSKKITGEMFGEIDYSDINHVKKIIKCAYFGELKPDCIISHIAYDIEFAIENLYKNKEIDDFDKYIVENINLGISNVDIAKSINRDEKTVRRRFNKVCRKISQFYSTNELAVS